MTSYFILPVLFACVGPSVQQTWGTSRLARTQGFRPAGYVDGLVGTIPVDVIGGTSCYDLCRDEYYSAGRSLVVSGCVCSQYDFTGPIVSGRTRLSRRGCPCSAGFVCVRGICERGNTFRRINTRTRSNCGYLGHTCSATSLDYNAVFRYTYSHTRQSCRRVKVRRACAFDYGVNTNVFSTLVGCRRQCEYNSFTSY